MKALVYPALLMSLLNIPAFTQKRWPLIQPAQKTERITLPNIDDPNHLKEAGFNSNFDLTIRSPKGDPLYKIECGNPDRSDSEVFEYSGDFQCRMILAGKEVTSIDLLSEVPLSTHDWQSRARFFAREVLGPCGEIADYGRERTFLLRGMKITLVMSDIQADKSGRVPTLEGFIFRADAVPDPSAKSRIAEAPRPSLRSESIGCHLDNSVPVHFH